MDAPKPPVLAPLMAALTLATGLLEAASLLALGPVFTAMQTGNVLFLAFGSVGEGGLSVVAPATSLDDMSRVIANQWINAGLCALFIAVLLCTVAFGLREILRARRSPVPLSQETPRVALAA